MKADALVALMSCEHTLLINCFALLRQHVQRMAGLDEESRPAMHRAL
jgi:hypothetical protein